MRARTFGLLLLVTVGMLPIVVAGFVMIHRAEDTALSQVRTSNARLAQGIGLRLAAFEQVQRDLLGTLADALNPAAKLAPEQADRIVKGYTISFPHLRQLDVVGRGADCMELATSRLDGQLRSRCADAPVAEALAGRVYRSPVRLTSDLRPLMTIAMPLELAGEPLGAVVAEIDMDGIWPVVNSITVGKHGRARLVGSDGTLIAHGDPAERGRVFTSEKDATLGAIRARPRNRGLRYHDARGRDVLAVWAEVPETGWTVIVEQPVAEAFAAANAMRRDLWIVVLASLAGVLVVGVLVGRSPVRSLEAMRRHAERIGKGELDARVPAPRLRELGDLARQLNQMAEELARMQSEIRRRERLSTFAQVAAGLAHDLQKPIERARDACHYVLTQPEEPKAFEALRRTWDGDLARLARYVLDLRRLAHERDLSLVPTSVDPRALAERLLADVAASPRWQDVKFAVIGHAEALWADEDLLTRALGNLVHNACDACIGREPAEVTIEIVDDPKTESVTFAVRDSGKGVSPERLDEILSGTFKSDKHTTGIGLGLAVARGVARAHGGSLEAESEVGRGSVFRVKLARLHVGDLAARDVSAGNTEAPEGAPVVTQEVGDAHDGRTDRGAA